MILLNPQGTLLLTRSELSALADLNDYIAAIEEAFRLYAEGKSLEPGLLHVDSGEVEFHIKSGGLKLSRTYFALKANGSCFTNMERHGLPNIMGAILLFDGDNGSPLAIVDSIDITIKRTGAATAVAAKYLARKDSKTVTICGCGNQGRIQLRSLAEVLPLEQVFAYDSNPEAAKRYAEEMAHDLSLPIALEPDLKKAARQSDVIITCTPSRKAFLLQEYVNPGTFIAGVGADSPDKQEIDPQLLAENKVVVDILEQCAQVGELHHALEGGLMTTEEVHGELGDVIAGKVPGRTSIEETIIYDATGTALQDAAGAALCYEQAIKTGKGILLNFFK
jgi:alanine dehydrogenase